LKKLKNRGNIAFILKAILIGFILFNSFSVLAEESANMFMPIEKLESENSDGSFIVRFSDQLYDSIGGNEISIKFPDIAEFSMQVEKKVTHSNGDITLISGDYTTENEMHVTVNKEGAVGYMRNKDGRFKLTYADGAFRVLLPEVMKNLLVPSNKLDYIVPPSPKQIPNKLIDSKSTEGLNSEAQNEAVIIDVMVVYTRQLSRRLGSNLQTRINQLISVANSAFLESNTNTQLALVHTEETNYTNNSRTLDALNDLAGGVGALANIVDVRVDNRADLVILLRDFDRSVHTFCGFAFVLGFNGEIPIIQRDFGFSVVQDGASNGFFCLDSSLAHEIGHNLGSQHDRNNSARGGILPFSHGHDISGSFFTVMSQDFNGTEVNRFSNPELNCLGSPCGIPSNASNSANNALSIRTVSAGIANFFSLVSSAFLPAIILLLDEE